MSNLLGYTLVAVPHPKERMDSFWEKIRDLGLQNDLFPHVYPNFAAFFQKVRITEGTLVFEDMVNANINRYVLWLDRCLFDDCNGDDVEHLVLVDGEEKRWFWKRTEFPVSAHRQLSRGHLFTFDGAAQNDPGARSAFVIQARNGGNSGQEVGCINPLVLRLDLNESQITSKNARSFCQSYFGTPCLKDLIPEFTANTYLRCKLHVEYARLREKEEQEGRSVVDRLIRSTKWRGASTTPFLILDALRGSFDISTALDKASTIHWRASGNMTSCWHVEYLLKFCIERLDLEEAGGNESIEALPSTLPKPPYHREGIDARAVHRGHSALCMVWEKFESWQTVDNQRNWDILVQRHSIGEWVDRDSMLEELARNSLLPESKVMVRLPGAPEILAQRDGQEEAWNRFVCGFAFDLFHTPLAGELRWVAYLTHMLQDSNIPILWDLNKRNWWCHSYDKLFESPEPTDIRWTIADGAYLDYAQMGELVLGRRTPILPAIEDFRLDCGVKTKCLG